MPPAAGLGPAPNKRSCRAPGCEEPLLARGFCQLHYHRWWRRNRTTLVDARRHPDRRCAVESCDRSARGGARGWCRMHYNRFRRHGDPEGSAEAPVGTRRLERNGGYIALVVKLAPDHPLAGEKSGWVAEARAVLWDKIGPGEHGCRWCGARVTWGNGLVADHVGGWPLNNSPKAICVSCRHCNLTRETPRRCRICGASLEGRRAHAWFCGAACRRRASRREWPTARVCRGCGELIVGRRSDAKWHDEGCRSRFRRRNRAKPGLEASNSPLKTAKPPRSARCDCEYPVPIENGDGIGRCDKCGARTPEVDAIAA
jgi:hypothetical protein